MKQNSGAPKKHIGRLIAVSVCSLLLFAAAGGLLFINGLLSRLDHSAISGTEQVPESVGQLTGSGEQEKIERELAQIRAMDLLQDSGIENILLIGADPRSDTENGRSDATLLLSINHDTGKIHLVSLMRAMYVCIPAKKGDTWYLLNAAYSWGGPQLLMDTIETNFRVHVDHYVVVDFSSFTSVIDVIGGVEITLSKEEAAYLKQNDGFSLSAGSQTLTGEQALAYTRIRYVDNDFVRTSRQRNVINALIQKAKKASLADLFTLANEVLPLVNTNFTDTQVLAYIANAGTLLRYPMSQMMLPVENQDGEHYVGFMLLQDGSEVYKVDFRNNIAKLQAFLKS